MRPDEARIGPSGIAHISAEVVPLIRVLARWADERPALLDATLFGERVRAGHAPSARLTVAVRYDEARLTEGFDDWIEQLRSGFSDLSAALRLPVDVIPPTDRDVWTLIGAGEEAAAMRNGKIRVVLTPTATATPIPRRGATRARALRARWEWLAGQLTVPVHAAIAAGRRFMF